MAHQRKNIRDAIKTLLYGNTTAGNNVFLSRMRPLGDDKLPAILIFPREEQEEELDCAPRAIKRFLTVAIEIVASGSDDETIENSLDAISLEVEDILGRDNFLADTAEDIIQIGTEFSFDGEGTELIASHALIYSIKYLTQVPKTVIEQDVNLEDLEAIDSEILTDEDQSEDDSMKGEVDTQV